MIRNINVKWFKNRTKRIKLMAISLATIIGFSVSTATVFKVSARADEGSYYVEIYDNEGNTIDENNQNIEVAVDDSSMMTSSTATPIQPQEDTSSTANLEMYNQQINFNGVDTSALRNLLSGHHTNYANSEFFHIQDALAKYNSMVEYESSSDLKIINNRQVDANKLHEIVVNNNNAYMASYTGALYEEFSSSYFEQAFNAVVATINKNLAEDYEQNIDVNQLDKNLQELKILCNHGQGNGVMVEDDKILSLNINVIEVFGGMDFFYEVACHETNHLIQASSNEEKEHEGYTKNTGIYYEWADLPVNALSYQWFVEGCAEKLMNVYNDVSGENIVYPEYMKTIDTLTLATILRDDVSELTIPRLSLQPDLNKFLRIFNANSEEDVEEIIKMMFSFEIIYGRNKAFYDNCQIEVPYKYEFSLYSSATQTLTKIFYTNLLDAIGNKGESLESIFGLIKLFENDMNRLVKYNDSSRDEYNSDFIAFYDNVQQTFFGCLAQQLGITSQDVFTMYNNYYMSDENLSTSNLLSDDEISYLTKYNAQNVGMKPTNVVLTNRK